MSKGEQDKRESGQILPSLIGWFGKLPYYAKNFLVWITRGTQLNNLLVASFVGYVIGSQFSISLTQISGFGGLAVWLTGLSLKKNWHVVRLPLWTFFGCFFLAYILSTLGSVAPLESVAYSKRLLEPLVFFWALNGLTLLSLIEYPNPSTTKWWGKIVLWFVTMRNRPVFSCLAFLILTATLTVYSAVPQIHAWGPTYRVRGPWTNPMTYGVILMMVLIVAIGWLLHKKDKRTGLVIAIVLLSIGIIVTHSRNAWVGLIAAMCFLFYLKNKRGLWAIPVFGLVAYGAMPGVVKDRINTFFQFGEGGIHKRFEMWRAASDVIRDHPILGCGYKCLFKIQGQYPEHREIFSQFQNMHSNYIQLTIDMGLVGLTAWLSIWIGYLLLMRKKWQAQDTSEASRCLVLIASAEVVAFLVAGVFETHFYDQEIMMVFYFILALPFVNLSTSETLAFASPSDQGVSASPD